MIVASVVDTHHLDDVDDRELKVLSGGCLILTKIYSFLVRI
jgi:hypothetical protein